MTQRPKIAVTGPRRGAHLLTWCNLLAVWRAGGRPIATLPGDEQRLSSVDGLLIGGGEHIDSLLYDKSLGFKAQPDAERDRLELHALEQAEKRSLPVFGICRGMQLINVFFDGTLNQDGYASHGGHGRHRSALPNKTVCVDPDSKLFDLVNQQERTKVNCLHEQSVDALGKDLLCSAEDTLGIVQGIERKGDRLVAGVQWHPEILMWRSDQMNIFRGLVHAAA